MSLWSPLAGGLALDQGLALVIDILVLVGHYLGTWYPISKTEDRNVWFSVSVVTTTTIVATEG